MASSKIVGKNIQYVGTLNSWLKPMAGSGYWKICYQASNNGWTADTFHRLCDNKGPTVTIVQVGQYVFGGYIGISWGKIFAALFYSGLTLDEACLTLADQKTIFPFFELIHNFVNLTASKRLRAKFPLRLKESCFFLWSLPCSSKRKNMQLIYFVFHLLWLASYKAMQPMGRRIGTVVRAVLEQW